MKLYSNDRQAVPICLPKNVFNIMRITVVLCLLTTFCTFASVSYSQNAEISLNLKGVTLQEAIDAVKEQSDFSFWYRNEEVDLSKKISVKASHLNIRDIMSQLLYDQDLAYTIDEKHIIIYKKNQSVAQQENKKNISGTITDYNGEPIAGANVLEKGSTNGTITDTEGRYQLQIRDQAILLVSYIGFITQEVPSSRQQILNIKLKEDTQNLEEVVVVGYGVQKKVNLTGSISVIDTKNINNRPLTNSSQALQGVQGLYVNQAGGQPGKDVATIRIRGVGTLNDNNPLVLVDGVAASLSDVNPNDIENISVLKDAASSAIYGSRAANGVILVTTKTGKKNEFSIQYNNSFSLQKVTYLPDAVWDPIKYMEGFNIAYQNEGKAPLYTQEQITEYREGMKTDPYTYPSTNWFDIAFRDAFMMEHNIRLSGGTDKLQTSFSIGYLDQNGVMIGSDNQKLSINFSTIATLGNLKAGINVTGNYQNFNEPHLGSGTYMNYTMRSAPIFTHYLKDGKYGRSWLTTPGQNIFFNLTAHAEEGYNNHKKTVALGNLFAEYTFPFDIKYKINLTVNKYDEINRVFTPIVVTYHPKTGEPQNSTIERNAKNYSYNNINPSVYQTLTWDHAFKKHDVSLLLGTSYETFDTFNFTASVQGFLDNSLFDINAGSKNFGATGAGSKVKLLSYFGRANYSFDNRYLVEANFRIDGSSRFAAKNRWGIFPSFSGGWRINQEAFMKDINWLSNLKIRGSWGQLGNQEIGLYKYVGTISLSPNSIFGTTIQPGGAITAAVDPNITWETTTQTNIGLDFGFFDGTLNGSAEFFKKRTTDILRAVNIPGQIGNLTGPVRNIGTVDNTGFEFGLNYMNNIGKLNYNIYGNMTFIKNEVIDIQGQEIISGRNITKEKFPIDSYYLYICDGIFQSEEEIKAHAKQSSKTAPGDLIFRDIDKDGEITEKDRVVTGSVIPNLTYSFGFNLNYKGFGLNAFFQGVSGVDTYPTANLATPYYNGASVTWDWLERSWTEENRNGGYPRLMRSNSGHDNYAKASTFWLKDASYLRLKNIQLSYTFPEELLKKIQIKKLTLFVNAENLVTFSDFNMFDPEKTLKGTTLYEYPSIKSFTGGLNVTF